MKVSIIHNTYQQRGGEDTVVAAEAELLRSAGHDVSISLVSNDEIRGLTGKVKALLEAPYSHFGKKFIMNTILEQSPDVIHIHNFFPRISPAAHHSASRAGVAVVQTLHNYRLLCAAATFLRNGVICEKCTEQSRVWGIIHRCYKDSFPGSAALVGMQWSAEHRQTWQRNVNRFIALTEFAKAKFVQSGIPADLISVKPNFSAEISPDLSAPRSGCIYVGRLSKEKGVRVAIEAFSTMPHITLDILGDGPERKELERIATPNIRFLGHQDRDSVERAMLSASLLILPSLWYEGCPMTVIEALACGTPVVASNIGAMPDLIKDGKTGALFTAGDPDSLRAAVRGCIHSADALQTMRYAATEHHKSRFSPRPNLKQIERIYDEAIRQVKTLV